MGFLTMFQLGLGIFSISFQDPDGLVSCCRMTCSGMRTRVVVGKIQIWEHGQMKLKKIIPLGAAPLVGLEARKT